MADMNGDTVSSSQEAPVGARGRVREKWGRTVDPGFLTAPYVLLLHQADMGLSSECLNVLLNLIAHWHSEGRMAYPHTNTIAKRMGVSRRSVQRSLSWLTKNGFVGKEPKLRRDDRQAYDLKPLVEKLEPYAWARIQLIQQKRHDEVLSDEMIADLAEPPHPRRRTMEEMFGSALLEVEGARITQVKHE